MTGMRASTEHPERLVISAAHWATVRELLLRHLPGLEVRAFGSRAGGKPKPASDLDLMVVCDKPIDTRQFALLADAFAESDLPFKVDLVDASAAPLAFLDHVLAGSIVVQPAGRDSRISAEGPESG